MIDSLKTTHYLLVCEIGPIFEYVKHSRKTIDYWSASFLFSHVMVEVAKYLKSKDAQIIRPYTDNHPEFIPDELRDDKKLDAGIFPDQIYAVISETNKVKTIDGLKPKVREVLERIVSEIRNKPSLKVNSIPDDLSGLSEYFNFFFIVHPLASTEPTHKECKVAEQKNKMRGNLRAFKLSEEPVPVKSERCILCGERKFVYTGTEWDRDEEKICLICLLRRFLSKDLPKTVSLPRFDSTTAIAREPTSFRIDEWIKQKPDDNEIIALKNEFDEMKKLDRLNSGFGDKFVTGFETLEKKYPVSFTTPEGKAIPNKWLNRPFYAIVYMDGDDMGKLFRKIDGNDFLDVSKQVSEILSEFTMKVGATIRDFGGQLIYAGGEDVNFMIHPERLIECIIKITDDYHTLFKEAKSKNNLNVKNEQLSGLTLSAGAVVCPHKYPLSRAIELAYKTLEDNAKRLRNEKNATAIKLIKGHTESILLTLPNDNLCDLIKLRDYFFNKNISRTTAHRFLDYQDLMLLLAGEKNPVALKTLIISVLEASREKKGETDKEKREIINKNAKLLMKFIYAHGDKLDNGVHTMIDALLYARFLTGDR